MYINSFVTELKKKIETLDEQIKEFENKMEKVNSINSILTLKTLKDIDNITKEDLIYLEEEDYKTILDVLNFSNKEELLSKFEKSKNIILDYQKKISEDKEINNEIKIEKSKSYLEEQLKYIKEYINDFNKNNKEYYNSLKISDNLYKKYLEYFKNNKLIKPIYNIEEFNEVIKKSGIITSEKWQLLKYIGEKNLDFQKNNNNKKETIEYSDDEIISFAEDIIKKESNLLKEINEEIINKSLELLDLEENEIKKMNITEEDVVKYQKIPIINTINKLLKETKLLLVDDKDEDAKTIEKNLKDLLELIDSYNVIKKIES